MLKSGVRVGKHCIALLDMSRRGSRSLDERWVGKRKMKIWDGPSAASVAVVRVCTKVKKRRAPSIRTPKGSALSHGVSSNVQIGGVTATSRSCVTDRKSVSYLVDPASSHMLVSKIKPCMSKFTLFHGETANGSLNQSRFLR